MEKINAKKAYLAPVLKVVSFNVEHGFAGSSPASVTDLTRIHLKHNHNASDQSATTGSTWTTTSSTDGWFN